MITVRCLGHIGTSLGRGEIILEADDIEAGDIIERLRLMVHGGDAGSNRFNTLALIGDGEAFVPATSKRRVKDGEKGGPGYPSLMVGENLALSVRCYLVPPGKDAEELKKAVSRSLPSVLVQAASSKVAQNERLVELLAWQTWSAKSSDSLLAKTPEMDLLLRLSGTTQISDAIRDAGAGEGTKTSW